MPTRKQIQLVKVSFISIFLASSGTLYHGDDESILDSPLIADPNTNAFTLMDDGAMIVYRDERRAKLVKSLALSKLSSEHQELIANAMAKVYVGIPVSSYTFSTKFESSQDENSESTNTSHVRAAGHIQRGSLEVYHSLDTNSPFLYFPPVPFESDTGKLLKESDEVAQFEFDYDFPVEVTDEDGMMSDVAEKMRWVFEFTVDRVDQSPVRITVKLVKPVRKLFRFKLSKVQLDIEYAFVDGCDCFGVSRLKQQMEGSALIGGKLEESFELTNTDITCEQPVQYLLPEATDSSFVLF